MTGGHRNTIAGTGMEFNQYRSYQDGDDLRRVDWKLFARSDRYYIRESEIETGIAVHFILDASASMLEQEMIDDANKSGLTKFDYARFLVAALGYLAYRQGDAIGLSLMSGEAIRQKSARIEPKRHTQQLARFFHLLERAMPAGTWPEWTEIEPYFSATNRREMIVVVTDMNETITEVQTALSKLSALHNEVLVCHILTASETAFAFNGMVTFEDLETGRSLEVDADAARTAYKAALAGRLQTIRQSMTEARIDYAAFTTNEPLDAALRGYLAARIKL